VNVSSLRLGGFLREAGTTLWCHSNSAQQFVAGERGIAPFSTSFVRCGLRGTARAT